jgi:hypothetical protein
MCAAVRRDGADGLVSRKRGRPSTHRFPETLTRTAVTPLTEYDPHFGPTLASEKLAERHGIRVSNETVRKLMIQSGLWKTRARRKPKIQQPRLRRPWLRRADPVRRLRPHAIRGSSAGLHDARVC